MSSAVVVSRNISPSLNELCNSGYSGVQIVVSFRWMIQGSPGLGSPTSVFYFLFFSNFRIVEFLIFRNVLKTSLNFTSFSSYFFSSSPENHSYFLLMRKLPNCVVCTSEIFHFMSIGGMSHDF